MRSTERAFFPKAPFWPRRHGRYNTHSLIYHGQSCSRARPKLTGKARHRDRAAAAVTTGGLATGGTNDTISRLQRDLGAQSRLAWSIPPASSETTSGGGIDGRLMSRGESSSCSSLARKRTRAGDTGRSGTRSSGTAARWDSATDQRHDPTSARRAGFYPSRAVPPISIAGALTARRRSSRKRDGRQLFERGGGAVRSKFFTDAGMQEEKSTSHQGGSAALTARAWCDASIRLPPRCTMGTGASCAGERSGLTRCPSSAGASPIATTCCRARPEFSQFSGKCLWPRQNFRSGTRRARCSNRADGGRPPGQVNATYHSSGAAPHRCRTVKSSTPGSRSSTSLAADLLGW